MHFPIALIYMKKYVKPLTETKKHQDLIKIKSFGIWSWNIVGFETYNEVKNMEIGRNCMYCRSGSL